MKKSRKAIALFLCLSCMIIMIPIVQAEDTRMDLGGTPTIAEQKTEVYQQYMKGELTEERYQQFMEKLNLMESIQNGQTPLSIQATRATTASLNVPHCRQEKSYYCGPATAQSIGKYFGNNMSQTTLAGSNYCNTESSKSTLVGALKNTLNAIQSHNAYAVVSPGSASTMSTMTYNAVSQYGSPAVYLIHGSSSQLPYGSVSGGIAHYIIGHGVSMDAGVGTIYVTDPYIGYSSYYGHSDGKYSMTQSELYRLLDEGAYYNAGTRCMMW